MLTSARKILGNRISTRDGSAGRVRDIYIKEDNWSVRYLVAGARRFLPSPGILLSPLSIDWLNLNRRKVVTSLSRKDLRHGPRARNRKTVSEVNEQKLTRLSMAAGVQAMPHGIGVHPLGTQIRNALPDTDDSDGEDNVSERNRLRSLKKLQHYRIVHRGEVLGRLEDFLLEDYFWIIRYLVVRLKNNRRILIPSEMIESVSWTDHSLEMADEATVTEGAPEYRETLLEERNRKSESQASSW